MAGEKLPPLPPSELPGFSAMDSELVQKLVASARARTTYFVSGHLTERKHKSTLSVLFSRVGETARSFQQEPVVVHSRPELVGQHLEGRLKIRPVL